MQYNVYVQGKKFKTITTPNHYNPIDVYDMVNEAIVAGDLVIDESKSLDLMVRPVGTELFE